MIDYTIVSKFLAGECSSDESKQISLWLNESEANKAEFAKMQELWLASDQKAATFCPNIEKAWGKVQQCILAHEKIEKEVIEDDFARTFFHWKNISRFAAAFLLVCMTAVGYLLLVNPNEEFPNVEGLTKITAGPIEKKQLSLADGTTVWINQGSSLYYPASFEGDVRKVYADGELFFQVKSNPTKPFIVEGANTSIKVLGTSFYLNMPAKRKTAKVYVEEGKVQFSAESGKENIVLTAGESAIYSKKEGIKKEEINPNRFAWKTKMLKFQNTPLPEVVEWIEAYYNKRIILEGKNYSSCQLTTTFNDQKLDEVLEVLKLTFDLKVEKGTSKIILHTNGNCKNQQ